MKVYSINIFKSGLKFYNHSFAADNKSDKTVLSDDISLSLKALTNYNILLSGINIPSFRGAGNNSSSEHQAEQIDSTARAIYAIDKNGNYKKYASIKAAARELGATDSNISKCLKGKQNTAAGHGFLYAEDVEKTGKNGDLLINHRRIEKKRLEVEKVLANLPVIRPFYAVDKDGNYIKFERNRDAVKTLGVSHAHITGCLNGLRDTTGGYAFVYADEVETDDGNGNMILNIDIPHEKFGQRTPVPVYAINETGRLIKYKSIGEAASALKVPARNINACLKDERETAMGYAFIRADELEVKKENGPTFLKRDILQKKFKQTIKHAVYVFDSKGGYKRYDSYAKAAEALNSSEATVMFCANGIQNSMNGFTVVKASYVEELNNGKVAVNTDILNKFSKEARELAPRAVIAVDADKHRTKFRDKKTAAQALGVSPRGVVRCLAGQQKTSGGYKFIYADNVVRKKRKPDLVYAIDRNGDFHEYKNIEEAAFELGVLPEEIQTFLRKGVTKDKQTTLNGYVFSTSNDE